jgi:hypothetical protein
MARIAELQLAGFCLDVVDQPPMSFAASRGPATITIGSSLVMVTR